MPFVFDIPAYLPLPSAYTVRAYPGTLDYNLRIREGGDVFFSLIVSLPGECPEDGTEDAQPEEEEYEEYDAPGSDGIPENAWGEGFPETSGWPGANAEEEAPRRRRGGRRGLPSLNGRLTRPGGG